MTVSRDDTHPPPAGFTVTAEPSGSSGRLIENVMFFARTLRAAGLPVGPGQVLTAIRAVEAVGIERRDDLYWTLHAVFVNRRDQQVLFDQAFHVFWRNPQFLKRMISLLLPDLQIAQHTEDGKEINRRLAQALGLGMGRDAASPRKEPQVEIDAVMTWSQRELLAAKDFEKMSAEEMAEAKQAIAHMRLPIIHLPTRRFRPTRRGRRPDPRASMRAALRSGRDVIPLKWKERRRRHPPLVILCDISGSMSCYSRMLLHFLHAVTNDRDRVHSFLFGTRLTNVTRYLRYKDVDVAVEKVAANVLDWSGGTRIGTCLRDFNGAWSRRVLGQGAVVLMISDGLDRDNAQGLEREMERLQKSCRRLIWLNPLLRYAGYEPRSLGARAIMPHVDEFRPVHNLNSLAQLSDVLSRPLARRQEGASEWLEATA
jgi:uncharacterized protein with von Willebrand factor type A (vWA) domain